MMMNEAGQEKVEKQKGREGKEETKQQSSKEKRC